MSLKKVSQFRKHNPFCDFCSTFEYERSLMEDRCIKYNKRSHYKHAHYRQSIVILTYITDNKTRVIEKKTKPFKNIRFCPVCGYDYVAERPYNGKHYTITVNNKEAYTKVMLDSEDGYDIRADKPRDNGENESDS